MNEHHSSLTILHIVEHGIALNSGYGFRSLQILAAQRARAWHPIVLTFPKPEESAKGEWKEPETIRGIRHYYRPQPASNGRVPFLARLAREHALARRVEEIVERERPDVLHAHSPVSNGRAALKVGLRCGIPVVYEMRSLWEEAAVASGAYTCDSRRYKRTRSLETDVCRRANRVVAISNGLKSHLVTRNVEAGKISVVGNGVDCDAIRPTSPDAEYEAAWKLRGKQVVGYIGSFRRYEGLDILVKAIAHLSRARPNLVLLLIGSGRLDVEADLRTLLDRLDMRERVIMPGWVSPERIPGVYALMDVMAYPRKRMPVTELITPLKPLEAMAMGKALVASDVGGHRELIRPGHNGLLCPADDEAALAEELCRLLDDRDLREGLAARASAWVRQERPWSKTTAAYSEVYDRAREVSARTAQRGA